MKMKIMRKIAGILIVSAIIGANLNAQTRNDVINAYNEGAKTMQTDVKTAIESFEKVIVLSDQVGETAADLKQKAVQVLPGLYVKLASTSLSEKKPAPETIKAAKKAAAAAEKYGSATNKESASKILVQGYYNLGTEFYTKKDYANALLAFDSLLVINPAYLNAIYNKALIFRSQNNATAFEQNIDLFLEKVKSNNDSVKVKQASKLALEYFRASGSQANQANKLDELLVKQLEKIGIRGLTHGKLMSVFDAMFGKEEGAVEHIKIGEWAYITMVKIVLIANKIREEMVLLLVRGERR